MAEFGGGVCTWPISYVACGGEVNSPTNCDALNSLSDVDQALVEGMAIDYLWRWTGRGFGLCETVVRPCRADCADAYGSGSTFWGRGPYPQNGSGWVPTLINGRWVNVGCGTCRDTCSCGPTTPSVRLPGPVESVTEVQVDGVVLDPSSYRLDGNRLFRIDGQGWPTCQDMSSGAGESGFWAITYLRGTPVPEGGQIAAGRLACEFAKALCGDQSCELPERVQTVTRQGVTVAVLDSFDDLSRGQTGIWIIDSWIASVTRPPRESLVVSPDLRRRYR